MLLQVSLTAAPLRQELATALPILGHSAKELYSEACKRLRTCAPSARRAARPDMVLLNNDPFLNELVKLFGRNKEKGTVFTAMKRSAAVALRCLLCCLRSSCACRHHFEHVSLCFAGRSQLEIEEHKESRSSKQLPSAICGCA